MHPPTSAYPWQPAPPPRKRAPWKTIGIATGSVLALCCGGFLAIGIFADPPASRNQAVTAADQAAGQQQPTPGVPETATAGPTGATTVKPSRKATSKPTPAAPKTTKPKPAQTTTKPKPKPTTKAPTSVYYKNCEAVRAAGAAPIRRGDPGYAKHLDRDGDGVGCEP